MSGLLHSSCYGTVFLTACPPVGAGTLTIVGTNFYGPIATLSVNVGCTGALSVNAQFTHIYCQLANGTAGSITSDLVVTTNGGTTTANNGFTIHYGTMLCFCCAPVLPLSE